MNPLQGWAVWQDVVTSTVMAKGMLAVRLSKEGAEQFLTDLKKRQEDNLNELKEFHRRQGKSEKWVNARIKGPQHITYTVEPYMICE